MAGDYYSELNVDGVTKDIYDKHAIHEDDFSEVLSQALIEANVKQAVLNAIFPVGAYYITANNDNPSTFLGGTWVKVEGKFLIGAGAEYAVNSEGGSADAIVPEHTHLTRASAAEAGSHNHTISGTAASAGSHRHGVYYSNFKETGSGTQHKAVGSSGSYAWSSTEGSHTHSISGSAAESGTHTHNVEVEVLSYGEDATGKNIPPYVAAYIWKRTA